MSRPSNATPIPWNEAELRLLRTVDLFQQKPVIMQNAEARLTELNHALQNLLDKNLSPCPESADITQGQIAKGENHKGFPYLSLDMPQLLNKEVFFTFRTLFWWGHYLGFSLILKGGGLEQFQSHLLKLHTGPVADGVYFSVSDTPWEWGLDEESYCFLNQLPKKNIDQHVHQKGFVKLLKVFPIAQPEFHHLDWSRAGLDTYQQMIQLISKQK